MGYEGSLSPPPVPYSLPPCFQLPHQPPCPVDVRAARPQFRGEGACHQPCKVGRHGSRTDSVRAHFWYGLRNCGIVACGRTRVYHRGDSVRDWSLWVLSFLRYLSLRKLRPSHLALLIAPFSLAFVPKPPISTRYLGMELVAQLLELGYTVQATVRDPRSTFPLTMTVPARDPRPTFPVTYNCAFPFSLASCQQ